jgi:hypothetical protein
MKAKLIAAFLSLCLSLVASAATTYDLSREFSVITNPNEEWTYGAFTNLTGGPLVLMTDKFTSAGDNGVPLAGWNVPGTIVSIFKIVGTGTATSDGGAGVYPPGTIKFQPASLATGLPYSVARFTVPADGAGNYHIETTARAYIDGPTSGDTDFHVLRNGVELFGVPVPGNGATGYTNDLALAAGDYLDFVTGPGQDGSSTQSGLKITARLTTICEPVTNNVTNIVVVTETVTNTVVVTNTVTEVVTNVMVITNTVSVPQLREAIVAAGLPNRFARPMLASATAAERALGRVDAQVQRRIAPQNPELAAEIQAIIYTLLGVPTE